MAEKELDNIDEKAKLNDASPDDAKIKFSPSKNGEAKIDIGDGATGYQCGLTKDELMKFANDPFWITLRRILFILFWALWIVMLVGAIAIIILTPKCAAPKEPEWYESSPIYQLAIDVFSDSDNDALGDVKGILDRLPYFEELSISTISIENLMTATAPMEMPQNYGTIDDFKKLCESIKVMIKVPLEVFPLSTPELRTEFDQILQFWIDAGAAGFIFDELEQTQFDKGSLTKEWSRLVANASTKDFPRITALSSYGPGLSEEDCVSTNMILNYEMIRLSKSFDASSLYSNLAELKENKTSSCRNNYVLGVADVVTMVNRFDGPLIDSLIMFTMLSDATPIVFMGDEYGRVDTSAGRRSPIGELTRIRGVATQPFHWEIMEKEKLEKNNNHFKVFTHAAKLRRDEHAIRMGDTKVEQLGDSATVVAMSRVKKGFPGFLVATNFGQSPVTVDFAQLGTHIPEYGHSDVVSANSNRTLKAKFDLKNFEMTAQETVILQFVPILS